MALLQEGKYYIRLIDNTGHFEVYETQVDRDKLKSAPSSEDILSKYDELITSAQVEYENYLITNNIAYKDTDQDMMVSVNPDFTEDDFNELLAEDNTLNNLYKKWNDLILEKAYYLEDLNFKTGCHHDHKYMKEYYPNLEDSIPKLIEDAWVELHGNTLEETYEYAKSVKRFGETIDI